MAETQEMVSADEARDILARTEGTAAALAMVRDVAPDHVRAGLDARADDLARLRLAMRTIVALYAQMNAARATADHEAERATGAIGDLNQVRARLQRLGPALRGDTGSRALLERDLDLSAVLADAGAAVETASAKVWTAGAEAMRAACVEAADDALRAYSAAERDPRADLEMRSAAWERGTAIEKLLGDLGTLPVPPRAKVPRG